MRQPFNIRSAACALAVLTLIVAAHAVNSTEHLPKAEAQTVASTRFFPMGWFDRLDGPSNLASMRSQGMDAVLPYNSLSQEKLRPYLDEAQARGLKVYVEINRAIVATGNAPLVRAYVELYRNHPAVAGWLLADEPTIDPLFQALTPSRATALYRQIKVLDPKRPVAMVFGPYEDPRPWLSAMDVMMSDDYVIDYGRPEFNNFQIWLKRLAERASMASRLQGYVPVIQAYGQDASGRPQDTKRLPTTRELRYLTFSAMQYKATGIFYWVRYRSRGDWIAKVLTPLSKEISPVLAALAAGPVSGAKSSGKVRSTLFRDPRSGVRYLVVVNHSRASSKPTILVSTSLGARKASSKTGGSYDISGGSFVRTFRPYEAQMYRLTR